MLGVYLSEISEITQTVVMHGSILPVTIPPPGNPWDKSSPLGPGVGNCLKLFCPGGGGGGKSKITSRFSCEARH